MRFRKKAESLPQLRRHLKLTSHAQVESRKLAKMALCMEILLESYEDNEEYKDYLTTIQKLLILKYFKLVIEPSGAIVDSSSPSRNRSIESFSDSECSIFFRFQKNDLKQLLILLKFPKKVIFCNRAYLSGEEVFLRGLYELVSGMDKLRIAKHVFGRDSPLQSRAFNWFINHIYKNFNHLVTNNLNWWDRNGLLVLSANAIKLKMKDVLKQRFNLSEELIENILQLQNVGLFLDCNCFPTSVVGGGPAEKGANAARWSDDIQRAFYNMWKSQHGLKHQTVDSAYGVTVDIFGPLAVRRNDNSLLKESELNTRLKLIGDITV